MKRILSVSLCALMLVSLFTVSAFAATKDMTAAYGTPAIDGTIDAIWDTTATYSPDVVLVDAGGEATADIKVLWDENYLYVLAIVKDDSIYAGAGNDWEKDCIEVFLDENNAKTATYEADDAQVRLNAAGEVTFGGNGRAGNVDAKGAAVETGDGYILELQIPFASAKSEGTIIGFDTQLADNDGGGGNKLVATIADDVTGGNQYQNASGFGNLTLLAAASTDAVDNSATGGDKEGGSNPQTGDNGFIFIAAAVLLASGVCFTLILKKQRA